MSNVDAVLRWRKTVKDRMVESMGSKCQCCGYNKCSSALAFHHIDPKKKDLGFGSIRANPKSWKKIVKELKKCILVCHNCHSEIHAGMRQLPADYTLFDTKFEDYREVKEHTPCPVCGTSKPATQKFCSHRCSQTNRRKVDWDKIDLLALMEKHSIKDLEQMLGISNAAIYKRRKKILANT